MISRRGRFGGPFLRLRQPEWALRSILHLSEEVIGFQCVLVQGRS
jgi:hypothetical protein